VASSLPSKQFSYLTNEPKYVLPCQRLLSRQSIDTVIDKEYEHIVDTFKRGLKQNCASTSDQRAKRFFTSILCLVRCVYTTLLSSKLYRHAHYEHRMVQRIQRRLKSTDVVIQQRDKSKVFHLVNADDYHRQAFEYMQMMKAYRVVWGTDNPCTYNLRALLELIDSLMRKKMNRFETIWKSFATR
jgi:hypothetical protein